MRRRLPTWDGDRSGLSTVGDWSGSPNFPKQRRNHDMLDKSKFQRWIEIAHRLFIEVDDATRFQRPDIVYFDDGLLLKSRNKCKRRSIVFAVVDAAKLLAQIDLNCGSPCGGIILFAGSCFRAA